MLRYALIARAGSGRKLFIEKLREAGVKVAISYTTRQPVNEDDRSHIFVTAEYAAKDPDKFLATTHNGNEYYYHKATLDDAEVISVDPENLKALTELYPDDAFRFICIMANNKDRLIYAVKNADDKITAEEDFKAICVEENAAFEKFEDDATNGNLKIPNMLMGHMVTNDFTEKSDMLAWVGIVKSCLMQFARMLIICEECCKAGIIERAKDGVNYNAVFGKKSTDEISINTVSPSLMAEYTVSNPDGMARIAASWLKIIDNSFIDPDNIGKNDAVYKKEILDVLDAK